MLYSLLLLFSLNSAYSSHDIKVTFYKISQEHDQMVLEVVVEQAAMEEALSTTTDMLTLSDIASYLEKHFDLAINGSDLAIDWQGYNHRVKHFVIYGRSEALSEPIEEIAISNTCLLTLEDQSNIIEITLKGRQRDFLMNNSRRQINVQYD